MPSRFALLLAVMSSFAFAGDKPVGAGCESSNECKTIKCVAHKCAPTSLRPQGDGSMCEISAQCLSRNCVSKRCGPRVKAASSSTTKTPATKRPTRSNPREEPEEDEAQPEEAPPAPERTPCTDDLTSSGVYASVKDPDVALRYAAEACRTAAPELLVKAKEVFLAGYGRNFITTIKVVKKATPEQLACAKKEYDKRKEPKYKRELDVPAVCLETAEVQRCAEALQKTVFKEEKSNATSMRVCKERSAETIAAAMELFNDGYWREDFEGLCNAVERFSVDELACMRREYDLSSNNKANYESFVERDICKRDAAVIECYFEFLDTFYVEEQYTDRRLRETIATYCLDEKKPDIELLKKVHAAGFTQPPYEWVQSTRTLTAPQKKCLEKWLKKAPPAEKTARSLHVPKECLK